MLAGPACGKPDPRSSSDGASVDSPSPVTPGVDALDTEPSGAGSHDQFQIQFQSSLETPDYRFQSRSTSHFRRKLKAPTSNSRDPKPPRYRFRSVEIHSELLPIDTGNSFLDTASHQLTPGPRSSGRSTVCRRDLAGHPADQLPAQPAGMSRCPGSQARCRQGLRPGLSRSYSSIRVAWSRSERAPLSRPAQRCRRRCQTS